MRSILILLLASASVATAQTPRPAKPPVKPAPSAAPRAEKPRAFAPWSEDLAPLSEVWSLDAAPLASVLGNLSMLESFQLEPMPIEPFAIEPFQFEPLHLDTPMFEPFQVEPFAQGLAAPKAITLGNGDWRVWGSDGEPRGKLAQVWSDQGTPEDSLYRAAREALNRGEYNRASTMFKALEQKYPRSRIAPAVLYYQAFALYRAGSTDEIRTALEVLKAQAEKYPDAASDPDAATLRTRLQAALAARGDAQAATALREATAGGPTCDREDVEVRAEALNALAQIDPAEARSTLKKVLARRDECSVTLRRRAVYILGRAGTDEGAADLLEVAKADPDPGVRSDAILMLGRSSGTATVKTLEQIFAESTDERTKQAVLSALRSRGGPDAKRVLKTIIERSDTPERMRTEAISQLAGSSADVRVISTSEGGDAKAYVTGLRRAATGDDEDAAYLRSLYAKTESQMVKIAIISGVSRIGGTTNDQWVLGIARNRDEDMRMRREALSRLRSTTLTVDDLGKLFESLSERELRSAVVYQLATRDEPAATDKLIEIARSGTDPAIRREAISALARKKDPRTTKLLLDLVERP